LDRRERERCENSKGRVREWTNLDTMGERETVDREEREEREGTTSDSERKGRMRLKRLSNFLERGMEEVDSEEDGGRESVNMEDWEGADREDTDREDWEI
jgi:hypothetical protein